MMPLSVTYSIMPTISFSKSHSPITVEIGENLLQALLQRGIPVASSCYGDGVCGRCKLRIISGGENLSPRNQIEEILQDRLRLEKDMRVSCQIVVQSDLTLDADYW